MKVIVTGATGTAGKGIVKTCLADQRITKVIILTRRAVSVDVESNPKTEVIMHHDFSQYPDDLMTRLKGAEACIWAIGGRVFQFNHDKDLCRQVNVDFTLSAAKAMLTHLATPPSSSNTASDAAAHPQQQQQQQEQQPFRFVFCSGKYSEWDQGKSLLFLSDSRKIKGSVEKGLCDLEDEAATATTTGTASASHNFEVRIARPSGILAPDAGLGKRLVGPLYQAISTEQLGKAMVRLAVEGSKERIVENDVLLKM